MEKLRMTSPDLTEGNIDKLAELFPNVVTEKTSVDGTVTRGINFDMLRQELSDHVVEGPTERYGLNWPGKRAAAFAANAPIAKTLRPMREESVNFDTTENLFIEGDNLDALKLLQESYLGKVKLIYIDPPYNTGNDFVYHDDFSESTRDYLARSEQVDEDGTRLRANSETNGRFHSDWLSMMYPRLKLARNLLSNSGLFFISIDDSEAASLVKICEEIFGADNILATISWEKRYTRSNNAKGFYSLKDTLIVCRRSASAWPVKEARDTETDVYKNPDDDPRGPWTTSSYVNPATRAQRPNLSYSIERPLNGEGVSHPTHAWKFGKTEHERHVRENRLWWGADGLATYPRLKIFLAEMGDGVVPIDLWTRQAAGTTDEGGAQIKELFGGAFFDFPKPTRLIKKCLDIFVPGQEGSNPIILDFFAGSSTTAHAVMEKNLEDGGERRFIMVQLNETVPSTSVAHGKFSSISAMSRERIRLAGTAISKMSGPRRVDTGFRTVRVASTNMNDVLRPADALQQLQLGEQEHSIKSGRTGEDLLFQVMLDWGLELSLPIDVEQVAGHEVHAVADDALLACFDASVDAEIVRVMAERQPLRAVFRDDAFTSDAERINAEQIFHEVSPRTEVKAI